MVPKSPSSSPERGMGSQLETAKDMALELPLAQECCQTWEEGRVALSGTSLSAARKLVAS